MPLGLVSSETLDEYWSQNTRRAIAYAYPNGTAPLQALLSLADTKETPHPEFGWEEERWKQIYTTTAAGGTSNTPFYLGGTTTTAGTTFTPTAGTAYRLYMADASEFQTDDVIIVHNLVINSGGAKTEVPFRVVSKDVSGTDFLEVVCLHTAPGAITNNSATDSIGKYIVYSGSGFAEGSRSRTGHRTFPTQVKNFTQIFKTAFELTRTALKEPLKYDKSGAYKDMAKKNGIKHLAGMEWDSFFGARRAETHTDDDTGETVSRRFMGGILWFLKQWELGSVSAGGAFEYGQSDVSAQTDFETYTNKRVIRLAGSSITRDQFQHLEGLPFERTNSTEWCKLCLCGNGYLNKVAAAYEKQVQKTELREEEFKGWNFQMVQREGNAGMIYYKTHPLFNQPNALMRNSAFYLDLGHLMWRPLSDSDTDIQRMIQLPDADKRKDQWLTEGSLEVMFPEAHMFVQDLGGITL